MEQTDIIVEEVKKVRKQRILKENAMRRQHDYYKNYYHNKLAEKVTCDHCNRQVNKQKFKLHQQTKLCMKIGNALKGN